MGSPGCGQRANLLRDSFNRSGTQSFKRKKARAVMLGLSISGGIAGGSDDRDSLVEDQNIYL